MRINAFAMAMVAIIAFLTGGMIGFQDGSAKPPIIKTEYVIDLPICRMTLLNAKYEAELKRNGYHPPEE